MSELAIIQKVLTSRAENPFTPTNDQKKAKSQFWTSFSSGAVVPPDSPNLSIAAQYAGNSHIRQWWELPGFVEWFWNQNEFDERLDYLAQIALDQLEIMVSSARTSDSSRIAAIKMILEASKKVGKTETYADEKVSKMDQGQLEQFIQSRIKLLT